MNIIRQVFCWTFLLCSAVCSFLFCWMIRETVRRHGASHTVLLALVVAATLAFAVIFATAWWSIWKAKRLARIWGVVASVTMFLNTLWPILDYARNIWVVQAMGVLGVIAFIWRDD